MLISLTLALLILPFVRMFYKVEIDYNEGWNSFYSSKAIHESSIYRNLSNWTTVNYPPLSFYINGLMGLLLKDVVLAGRLVSLLSLLFITYMVGYMIYKSSGAIYESLFAAFFCLASIACFATYYVAMFDPQLLGHVFTLLAMAIYCLDFDGVQKAGRLALIALLCALGLLIKHSIIAVPIAISIDILLRSRKIFIRWSLACTAIAIITIMLSLIIFGREIIAQLAFPRTFSVSKLLLDTIRFGVKVGIPIIVLIPWLFHVAKIDRMRIYYIYLIAGIFIGVLAVGGSGVDVNLFFDSYIALPFLIGFFLIDYNNSRLSKIYSSKLIHITVPYLLLAGIILISVLKISRIGSSNEVLYGIWRPGILNKIDALEQAHISDSKAISQYDGPILCENLMLNYLSGKPFVYDPFYMGEAIVKGKIDESEILRLIESGYFVIIQLKSGANLPNTVMRYGEVKKIGYSKLTENMKIAIASNYHVLWHSINGWFYGPNSKSDRPFE
jgi:hypothetical protein